MANWSEINEQIRACRNRSDWEHSLRQLFETKRDGMVATALAQEFERRHRFREALQYYEEAERLFPLEQFKQSAREGIERVFGQIESIAPTQPTPGDLPLSPPAEPTLIVVSCTHTKIWDEDPNAPKYVLAREAYGGKTMQRWLESSEYRQGRIWVVLSAKYGFIEADQPISRYDVTFSQDDSGPFSLDSLRAQVEHHKLSGMNLRLRDFRKVEVWGSPLYFKIVASAFMRTGAEVIHHASSSDE